MNGPRRFVVALLLAVLTLAVFSGVAENEFVRFDDDGYITANPRVLAGLSREGVRWALRSTSEANWHPLTWISHMADVELFGLHPGPHHLVSLALHTASVTLLFLLLSATTGTLWRSALAASLFAVHPLHVESVAWAAERKDVLGGLFWMLASHAWLRHLRRPGLARYLAALLLFAAGLLAKPMLVTLPLVWLLCDFWPFARCRTIVPPLRLWIEKIPFLLLSAAVSVVTFLAQSGKGAVAPDLALPLAARLANALASYLRYLGLTVWPRGLAVFYPLDPAWSIWSLSGSAALLAGLTWLVLRARRRHPYLPTGWFWYLGTLLPVIGLAQVGAQAMADRYTYLPLIGVFVALAWGAGELAARGAAARTAISGVAVLWIVLLAPLSARQVRFWHDDLALFGRALAVTHGNWFMENNMGIALADRGDLEGAQRHYRESLRLRPQPNAYNNLGTVLGLLGRFGEAQLALRRAVQLAPSHPEAHFNLALALEAEGRMEEAEASYREALRINPENTKAHHNLGLLLFERGDSEGVIKHLAEALAVNPRDFDVLYNLGLILERLGRREEAAAQFRRLLARAPDHAGARQALGRLEAGTGADK